MSMLHKVKTALRITHNQLDDEIQSNIDAALADLEVCGVTFATIEDPLILNAVKLYCRSLHTDDPAKAAEWLRRYESMKASLMMAEGYGWEDSEE